MSDVELIIIGAGQMRTGTNSLKLALEKLYGTQCYHMIELFEKHRDHVNLWIDALDKQSLDKNACNKIFKGYNCAVDYPASIFYKDLMNIYPNAKIILTTRETEKWVKSVKNTTLKAEISGNIFHRLLLWQLSASRFQELKDKMLWHAFGLRKTQLSDENLRKAFDEYNDEVRRSVPKERLLEFQVKDGWGPLCKFLNIKQIPSEPFPFVNTTDEFEGRIRKYTYLGLLKNISVFIALLIPGIFIFKKYIKSR